MASSDVFFTDFRVKVNKRGIHEKIRDLLKKAGFAKVGFENRFAALKIHFGEPGNLAYLRPNYARIVVDAIKELGGRPFLTDCNTLYVGRRKNALEHLESAWENGFTPLSAGCPILIADGLKGNDETLVPIEGEFIHEAKIGRAIMDADIIVSLNHFKMHECTGIGGALKNIGMGCGSRAGKREMHAAGKPVIDTKKCVACGFCRKSCGQDAISPGPDGKMRIDKKRCAGCGRCIAACPVDAVETDIDAANDILNKRMVEYAAAVLQGRPQFHLNFVMDVVPYCDCHSESDVALVPNVGIFASTDAVALDAACADAVNRQPIIPGSLLDGQKTDGDYFRAVHPSTDWRIGIEHGVKMGIGNADYRLIEVK